MRSLAKGAVLLSAATILGACTPAAPSVAGTATAPQRGTRNVISRLEIEQSNAANALELIYALRPGWFTHRGQESMALGQGVDVYVDNQKQDRQFLAQLPLNQLERLDFLSPTEATFRFGTQEGSGAIVVTMRRR